MSPSIWQILIVVALVMLLFGAGRLPRMMGDLAEGIKSFKKGMRDEEEENSSTTAKKKAPAKTKKTK